MGFFNRSKVTEVATVDPRMKLTKPALIDLLGALERENRVLKLQNARIAAERVMLQELARQLQNMNQNQMVMLGDVINNTSGMLTDENVQQSVKLLASTIKQIQPTAVEDVITRLALLDPRTQGIVAAPERQLAHNARVINPD
jgi:hypothetical protein